MIDQLFLCGNFWQPLWQSLMTQPVCMRAIHKYHLILTETARYLCLWGHVSALCRGIDQFRSYKSIFFAKLKLLTYHLCATQFPWPPQPFQSELSRLWKICRVCVLLFKSMKGFRMRKRPFLRFVSLDNKIRNLTFINFTQNYTVGRTIFWQ